MTPTLKQQLETLKVVAHKRGMRVRKDRRLTRTPYCAMNPHAGRELGQPYVRNSVTYQPATMRRMRKLVMDIRHELVEEGLMRRGVRYKAAHKIANRKQRNTHYRGS